MGFSSSVPSSSTTQKWLWVFRAGMGLILLATLLFLLGFFTKMWFDDHTVHYGLWRVCTGSVCKDVKTEDLPSYRIATQAFQCLAFAAYGLAPFLHYICYCTKGQKGFGWRIRVFDIIYGIGVAFHLTSVLIFGLEQPHPEHFSWSFEMTAASVAINAVGIFLVAFSRKRALHDFSFCLHKGNSKRNSRVGISGHRGSHRGSSQQPSHHFQLQQTRDRQNSPSSSNGSTQLVFGPREPHYHHQQYHQQGFILPPPQPNVHYGGGSHQQQQGYTFYTQTSGASNPPQLQQGVSPYPPQPQPQAPPSYPPQNYNEPSAPLYPSQNPSYPSPSAHAQPQQTGTDLPPIRGIPFNSSNENDSFDGGKPPPYEDVLYRTPDNHYQ
ncbi:hypothetical protein PoB_002889400 [Plakobranchus ocellatus]|uniref:MARVEL domain-containing protein n=1 Tax=Plakobranchus ocellatus TaxID=259542 RepID=A0AAV4A3X7_9GAST|nr:hypothetical protein PoB_002889400 [Plakobranchus ocellatus]